MKRMKRLQTLHLHYQVDLVRVTYYALEIKPKSQWASTWIGISCCYGSFLSGLQFYLKKKD